MIESWYITGAAVREYQAICGIPETDEGPLFDRCAVELERACETARLYKDEGPRQIWISKATIRGRRVRLELYVSLAHRPEGDAPQLVRVRRK